MKRLHKFKPKTFLTGLLTAIMFFTITWKTAARHVPADDFGRPLTAFISDTIPDLPRKDSLRTIRVASDTVRKPVTDTAVLQSRTDTFTLNVKLSKDSLDAPVKYEAEDSAVVLVKDKKILLYGKTQTEYKDITVNAPKLELDNSTQIVTAVHSKDSNGVVMERAYFKQAENQFSSDTIRFNFKTQKGFTNNTVTQQEEMFIHAGIAKQFDKDVTFIKGGQFTTCNLDHPHFALRTNKMKVINQKIAVSGPAHPEFEGVPVPVYIPFGMYPLKQGRRSGLLAPQFATNEQMGIGLEGLGYHKVLNDYWDVTLRTNIYSYGGWAVMVSPNYRKRYRYNGAFSFNMQKTKGNFKGDPDFFVSRNFNITWSHTADSRARPGTSFSANVNAGSTQYNRFVTNDPMQNIRNQLGSSITYSKTWKDKPYNLTLSANHFQNSLDGLVNINLPDLGFTVNTLFPFQRKNFAGSQRWYEKLGIGYNGTFRNQVSFYDTAFTLRRLIDTLQWGAQHNIPITVSLPPILDGAIMVAPSVSYSQVWIAQKFRRTWNDVTQKLDTTVTKGFFTDHNLSFGLSFNTAIFGLFEFRNSRIKAIRHVIRPTLSMNYRPDLSRKHYYTTQVDASGYQFRFSEFAGALYPGYAEGKTGGLSFGLDNNLEMKVKTKDSTADGKAEKKIRLIDGYGLSLSYNFLADSMQMSPVSFYFRTNLFDKINISANASMSPYQTDDRGRDIAKYAWQDGKFKPGRLTSGGISVSTSFQSKPKDPQKDAEKKKQIQENLNSPELQGDQQRLLDYMRQNPSEFVDFNIPWQVSLSYSLTFNEQFKPDYSGFEKVISSNANFNGSFSLTPKWNFSVNGFYNFDDLKLQTFTMSISREMHCWQMSVNVTPVGPFRFFNISISPKSSLLQDLRINRTRSFSSF